MFSNDGCAGPQAALGFAQARAYSTWGSFTMMVDPRLFAARAGAPSRLLGPIPGFFELARLRLASTAAQVLRWFTPTDRARARPGAPIRRTLAAGLLLAPSLAMVAGQAGAAKSDGCEGGGFAIENLNNGGRVDADGQTTIPASNLGQRFLVK